MSEKVKISDSVTLDDSNIAASSKAVKMAYDKANEVSGVVSGSYGPASNASPAHGASFIVPQLTVNENGRITSVINRTIKLPAATTANGATAGIINIGDITTSKTYTAPKLGMITGFFYHGNATYRYVYINDVEVWRCRWGDSGWGDRQEPFSVLVGKGGVVKVGGETARNCKFIPINL